MAGMNQYVAQAKQFWASRTGNQRIFLGVGAAATVAMIAFFANLMLTPDYKPLIGSLEPADAQTITTELTAKKIPYQLSPDGKSISVPADQVDAARMSVASSEPTHSGRLGFELFDKVSWGETEFDEKVNYQRALEGELERTIMTLGGVKSARVHLVMATDSVFLDRERGAKASVTLKLNRGGLSHDETMSIQRLVAGAVDGLKPADVSIIDADSNESLGATGDGAAGEEGVERELSQRLVNTLTPVLGGDHVRASVNVEYDQGSKEVNEDKYDPTVVVPLVSQKSKETNGGADGTSGVAGTTSNVPQTTPQANVPAPDGADANQSSTTDNTTYGVNKVTTHSIEPAGRIRRITAAVVVDDLVKRKLQPNGKWTVTRQPRSLQELKQIEMLASTAIGIDATRGDVINVENLSFDRPDDSDVPVPTILDKARKGVEDYSSLVRYGMLLALFALAYVLMIRPVQKRVLGTGIQTPPEALLADGGKPLSLAAPAPEVMRTLHLKERLIEQVKAEPATSARVVQAWLRGATE
jgi:flagellar M-ring protein FliF